MKDIDLQAFEKWWSAQETGLGTAHKFTAWNAWLARAAVEADRAQRVPDGVVDSELVAHIRKHIDTYADKHPALLVRQLAGVLRTLLASTPAQPAQQELERALEPRMSRACLDAWDRSDFTSGPQDAVHPMFLDAFSAGFKAAAIKEQT